MKKISYLLLGATGLLLASCSNEDLVSNGLNQDGTANVTLTLSTPQISTRAYSDGTTAQKLQYAVFEKKADGTLSLINKDGYCSEAADASPETIELRKQMNFKLLTDHTYRFVFWAESEDDAQGNATNPYEITFNDNQADLTVDFSKLNGGNVICNNENLDAFYGGVELNITGNVQMDVPLYRPFAQINIGTNDLADAAKLGYPADNNKISSMIKTKTYTSMSLLDGEISGTKSDVQFSFAEIPSVTDGKFPVSGYDYLAMTYILVPDKDDELVDVTFNYKEDGETLDHARTVGSVPVKRNHRTNIYGQILTSNADLTIHIEPAYDDPDLQPSELEMAAALGGSLLIKEDQNIDGSLTFFKDAVVDFGGNQLNTKGGGGDAIVVKGGANVYLKNGTINENEDADANINANIYIPNSTAATNVTLEDMKVTGARPVYLNNAAEGTTVTIKSGEYYSNNTNGEAVYVQKGGKVIIEGGLFKNNGGTNGRFLLNLKDDLVKDGTDPRKFIEVRGGTFVNYDPSHSASENPVANFVANGYVVRENQINNDTYYTVVPEGNKEAVVEMIDGKAYCLAPALPEGATEEQFKDKGGLYVVDGEVKTFAATTAGIIDALKNGTEIYFAPNSVVNLTQSHMQVQQQGITVYGNGATFGGSGEWDISVQSWASNATNYPKYDEGSTINVNVYDLNNVKVWGALNQDINLNVYLKNCTMVGTGTGDTSHSLIMVRGADEGKSTVSITLEDCYAKNVQVGVHTMYKGEITINNCEFDNVGIPINYAKKLVNESGAVIVKDCVFNNCGLAPLNDDSQEGAANYAAPIRVVDNAGPDNSVSLLVDNCTFNNTVSNWDILLMEYRTSQPREWYPINYTIQNCVTAPSVRDSK